VIVPSIHHSRVKPASLEWECIPDPTSLCKITLQNLSNLPWQGSASQETTGDQELQDNSPALVTHRSWLVNSPTRQVGCFSHQLSHRNALSPHVCIFSCSSHPSLHHRLGRNYPCWLDSWWKVFISSLLSLLGRMHNYCFLLLIWFPFKASEPSSCDLCMHTTQAGSVVTKTLIFSPY
jgi:hypothetical protein